MVVSPKHVSPPERGLISAAQMPQMLRRTVGCTQRSARPEAPTLSDMSGRSPHEGHDVAESAVDGPLAEYAAYYDDYDSEPTEAERAEAVEQFLADCGRFPGVAEELDRARQAEIEADYPDEPAPSRLPTRREPASIEL